MDSCNKVKDILKEPTLDLDANDNKLLFGEKLKKKSQNYDYETEVKIGFNGSLLIQIILRYIKSALLDTQLRNSKHGGKGHGTFFTKDT